MAAPRSPVALEAATLLLDRGAHQQFAAFMAELWNEREVAVRNVLAAGSAEDTLVAKGAACALDDLYRRMSTAQETLNKHQKMLDTKERAR